MSTPREITAETMKEIYTNKKLRNAVANAHSCLDQYMKFKHKKALYYPIEYIVNEEQIAEAKAERERASAETIRANVGNLLFTGMGSDKELGGGVTNHRFRAAFMNDAGKSCFVEFSYCDTKHAPDCLNIDFFITDYKEERETYNRGGYVKKDMARVLEFVNNGFGCSFKGVFIDNWDANSADFVSVSPKAEKAA